jgi:hypothetical protein
MFLLELGEAMGYFHAEFRLGVCAPLWSDRRLSAIFRCLEGAALLNRTHFSMKKAIAAAKTTNEAGPQTDEAPRA